MNIFKSKKATQLFEITLVSVYFYLSCNFIKILFSPFFEEGTIFEFFGILISATTPLLILCIMIWYFELKKRVLASNSVINKLHTESSLSKNVVNYVLISSTISIVFLLFNVENIAPVFILDVIKNHKFYILDFTILIFFSYYHRTNILFIIRKIVMTKLIFIWFVYLISLSYINVSNDLAFNNDYYCPKIDVKTVNLLVVQNKKCNQKLLNDVNNIKSLTVENLVAILSDSSRSKEERANILNTFNNENEILLNSSWIELNFPRIFKNAYNLKMKQNIIKLSSKDKTIIDLIIKNDQVKIQDYKLNYKEPSMAMIIIKN